MTAITTLVELLEQRTLSSRQHAGYIFLEENEEQVLSYQQLARDAKIIAAHLQQSGVRQEPVMLLYPPGLDYIRAFFGALYAGAIPVPAYPPDPGNLQRTLPRLKTILGDAQATWILTTTPIMQFGAMLLQENDSLASQQTFIATDNLDHSIISAYQRPTLTADDIAFLQYTSGATAAPKGVMLTHANLLANSELISQCFAVDEDSKGVIWLPPYHDMGLIGGILQPLYGDFPIVLMSPFDFLRHPFQWLKAISDYRATISGGPNFAYNLAVRKIRPEQRQRLDLSTWQIAFNGAEPVNPDTLERFAATFAESGFQKRAFYPCYGLAEATLIVSGGHPADTPRIQTFDHTAPVADELLNQTIVSCGSALPGHPVCIVDSETGDICPDGQIGEIHVAGASVAKGYWKNPAATADVFGVQLQTDDTVPPRPFLKTGDLGFLYEEDLFVVGRIKDLMIIRGRNYYPQDIELTVEQVHPAIRQGCGAAFAIDDRIIIVQEVRPPLVEDYDELAEQVRRQIALEHGIAIHTVIFTAPHTVPKTSSGKIQRHATRRLYDDEALDMLGATHYSSPQKTGVNQPDPRIEENKIYLVQQLGDLLNIPAKFITTDTPLVALGLDSVGSIELLYHIEEDFGLELAIADITGGATLQELATQLAQMQQGSVDDSKPHHADSATPPRAEFPLSFGQRTIWFMQQLQPDQSVYNLSFGVELPSGMEPSYINQVLAELLARYPLLQVRFPVSSDGNLYQTLDYQTTLTVSEHTLTGDETQYQHELETLIYAPFNLDSDVLLRVMLVHHDTKPAALLFVVHHIIADLWSLVHFASAFFKAYARLNAGQPIDLSAPSAHYDEYVDWQIQHLDQFEAEHFKGYWQDQLAGTLPVLDLMQASSGIPDQRFNGATHPFTISEEATARLGQLAHNNGVTLFTVLLSIYAILLQKYTRQNEIMIGSATSGRTQKRFADLFGYVINVLPLRLRVDSNQSFLALLNDHKLTVNDALTHEQYPFAKLVEKIQPRRQQGLTPLFQAMFLYQNVPNLFSGDLAPFIAGLPGATLHIDELTIQSMRIPQKYAQFDLTLAVLPHQQSLLSTIQYNTDRFQPAFIEQLAQNFQQLIDHITHQPAVSIRQMSLLNAVQTHRVIKEWNQTATAYDTTQTIATAFEDRVQKMPHAIALVFENHTLTYQEVNTYANQVAHYLIQAGTGIESRIGVYLKYSIDLPVYLLGILKAGATYIPLDPQYPEKRLQYMIQDARVTRIIADTAVQWVSDRNMVLLTSDLHLADYPQSNPRPAPPPATAAYVLYTSGSSGQPKGVVVSHQNVINFFAGMDVSIGATREDTLLAVTSMSFDISVLEIFWSLTRGLKVVLMDKKAMLQTAPEMPHHSQAPVDFSLFYFANNSQKDEGNIYRLVLEGAQFADRHGFKAIWTPERHFHPFGGLYPNPSVISAALAVQTSNLEIRAGSVVLPLHSAIRVAEEWAIVDNLSGGRVGIACTSGWQADDFVFFPDNYPNRKQLLSEGIDTIRTLWQGGSVIKQGGLGNQVEVSIYPQPVQEDLPVWITAAGNPDTFLVAARNGANILTHLLGQSINDLSEKIAVYRQALAENGYDPEDYTVTVMLHTFIGDNEDQVRDITRQPMKNYLASSLNLIERLIESAGLPIDMDNLSDADMETLLEFAFNRYYEGNALFGTVETAAQMVTRLQGIGVDEIACLIDFGIADETVLNHLPYLNQLKDHLTTRQTFSFAQQALTHQPTILQCTPSTMHLLSADERNIQALVSLDKLLLGGEELPAHLVSRIQSHLSARIYNMYGPTETTIWSTVATVSSDTDITIGRPVANTQVYILDDDLQPAPIGVTGTLYIAGAGVTRGYLNNPRMTAERFLPDPFSIVPGARMYHTGDLAFYQNNGQIKFIGRSDYQVKINGYRIEPGEIEAVFNQHPEIDHAIVLAKSVNHTKTLVAYIQTTASLSSATLRQYLQQTLPNYMIPAHIQLMNRLPLTANNKIDRRALLERPLQAETGSARATPATHLEQTIARIWQMALHVEQISLDDNFFDLGGHSLLIVKIHQELQHELDRQIPLIALLENPTISAQAMYLSNQNRTTETILADINQRSRRQRQRKRQKN